MNLTCEEIIDYINTELSDKLPVCKLLDWQIDIIYRIPEEMLCEWSKILIERVNTYNDSK